MNDRPASGQDTLRGRTALVTGGARRIGAAVVHGLAAAGVHVAVHCGRSRHEAEKTAERARAAGVRAAVFQADLDLPQAVESLVPRVLEEMGPLDILVNNASIFPRNRLADFTPEDLAANVRVNALAPLLLSRRFAAQGREGCIINFLDTRIADYDADHAAYHLSKRMLFSLTRMMALEFAPAVRVNAVAPGLILPPPGKDAGYLQQKAGTNPLNRTGSLSSVVDAVLYLLAADFVTGQVMYVDGGRNLKGSVYG